MLITAFVHVRPEGHREPRNEVGSLSPAERLAGFEPGTFRFWLQRLNPLGRSPRIYKQRLFLCAYMKTVCMNVCVNWYMKSTSLLRIYRYGQDIYLLLCLNSFLYKEFISVKNMSFWQVFPGGICQRVYLHEEYICNSISIRVFHTVIVHGCMKSMYVRRVSLFKGCVFLKDIYVSG